jgi:hypothetical protein
VRFPHHLSLPSNKKLDTEIQKIGIPMRSCTAPTTACNSQSSSAWIGRTSLRTYSVLSPGTYPPGKRGRCKDGLRRERDKMRLLERCTCAAIKKPDPVDNACGATWKCVFVSSAGARHGWPAGASNISRSGCWASHPRQPHIWACDMRPRSRLRCPRC